jgi:hypothetical protein
MSPMKDTTMNNAQKICDAHIHLFPDRLMEAILHWFVKQGWTEPFGSAQVLPKFKGYQCTHGSP